MAPIATSCGILGSGRSFDAFSFALSAAASAPRDSDVDACRAHLFLVPYDPGLRKGPT